MQRNAAQSGWNFFPWAAIPARVIGAVLIALSLLRWPATAMLASAAWDLSHATWVLILAVQAGAEAIFWIGVWMIGRRPLRRVLARVADAWPVRAVTTRMSRVARSLHARSGYATRPGVRPEVS